VFDGKRLYFEDINKNNSIKLNSILKEYKTYDSVIRASSPSISVDGKTLIFIASNSSIIPENSTEYGVGSIVGTNEPDKLGILNMETNNISLIDISNLSNALYPFWSEPQISPDGKYVIWVQEPSSESGDPYVRVLGYFEIFKLDLQTNEITQITNLKSAIEHPVFMDNKTIVFLKDSDYKLEDQYGIRTNEIWTIDINGADLRRLLILRN
jgi:Tol biopolymer transport system component